MTPKIKTKYLGNIKLFIEEGENLEFRCNSCQKLFKHNDKVHLIDSMDEEYSIFVHTKCKESVERERAEFREDYDEGDDDE